MLENTQLSTVKLKIYISKQEVSYLPSNFGLCLHKELKFSKTFFSFIDLWLHFNLCENGSYIAFAAGFFYMQKSI